MIKRISSMKTGLVAGIFLSLGCGNTPLDKLEQAIPLLNLEKGGVAANFCNRDPHGQKSVLKLIFMMDKSSSNTGLGGTDPGGVRRFPPIIKYLDSYDKDPNIYFGMILLLNDQGKIVSKDPQTGSYFTNNGDNFKAIVQKSQKTADNGGTPYISALSAIQGMIKADIKDSLESPKREPASYVIFFISDGQPTDSDPPHSAVLGYVDSLLRIREEHPSMVENVILHTGYYYATSDNKAARQVLTAMAARGKGTMEEFSGKKEIDFGKYRIPSRTTRYTLKDIIAVNASFVWNADGTPALDSDGDGLSDDEEAKLGSDPQNRDSDGNQVNDKVEFETRGIPCKDRTCDPKEAEKYADTICIDIIGGEAFKDWDGDLLNNCEEKVLNSKPREWDTNNDFIPDQLALHQRISITNQNESQLNPDLDDLNNYNEIKLGSPPLFDNGKLPGLQLRDYALTVTDSNPMKSCYRLDIENFMVIGADNLARIYLLESTIDDRKMMRMAEKRVGADGSISFTEEDFK